MMNRRILAALSCSLGLMAAAHANADEKIAMLQPTEAMTAPAPSGYELGALSEFNQGYQAYFESDFQASMALFQYAAYDGSREAQEFLGLMYLGGNGVYPKLKANRANAVAWLEVAAKRGSQVATQTLEILNQGKDDYARFYLGTILVDNW